MKTLFLHMPKCAGSSMRKILKQKFKENYVKDYQSFHKSTKEEQNKLILDSIESPKKVKKDSFVFGHFYPVKYLGKNNFNKKEFRLITFLREPLERLASHYSFWTNSKKDHYLWTKMTKENWTFKEFCLSEEMKNFYSQYLIHVPISNFDFVGTQENIKQDWERLCKFLEIEFVELPKINETPNQIIRTLFKKTPKEILKKLSDQDKQEIEEFHSLDVDLYKKIRDKK